MPFANQLFIFEKTIPVRKCLIILMGLVFLGACRPMDLYEKTVFFPKQEWESKNQPSFNFEVTDTLSNYHIYVVIRHQDAYHYNNLWLNVQTKGPGMPPITQKLNLTLANNTRGWLGSGMDDVFDHRIRITTAPIRFRKGVYQFTLQQIMREDPLPYVLNAGIRIEKAKS
jgi:gliding motility-associated lipoprotein GldH